MKRALLLGLCLVLLALGVLFYSAHLRLPARLVDTPNFPADAYLVLSGDPGIRTHRGAELALAHPGTWLVITGTGRKGDSAHHLAWLAERDGMPRSWIKLEDNAKNTVQNMRNTRPLLDALEARRVVVVTSFDHSRRAGLLAEHLLGRTIRVRPVGYWSGRFRLHLIEALKLWVHALVGDAALSAPIDGALPEF